MPFYQVLALDEPCVVCLAEADSDEEAVERADYLCFDDHGPVERIRTAEMLRLFCDGLEELADMPEGDADCMSRLLDMVKNLEKAVALAIEYNAHEGDPLLDAVQAFLAGI